MSNNLIVYVNIVIAPLLVGGKDVSTLIDGEAISYSEELNKLKKRSVSNYNKAKGYDYRYQEWLFSRQTENFERMRMKIIGVLCKMLGKKICN